MGKLTKGFRLAAILLLSVIASLLFAAPVMALPTARVWENCTATADNVTHIWNVNWASQTFTTGTEAHTISQVRLLLYREGAPGTVTVSIKKVNGSGAPDGADLTSGTTNGSILTTTTTGEWYGIDLTPYSLSASTQYAIVVRAQAGTGTTVDVNWRMDGSAGAYTGGSEWNSANSGISWTADTDDDYMFQVWGESLLEVTGAQVFRGYYEPNDMLFVLQYYNTYVPYYPNADPASYFTIQLRSTNGATVIAQTTCRAWGNKPGSIYLSADSAAGLTTGSAYRIYVYGDFTGTPSKYYSLQSTDWRGTDLTFLDQWVLTTARNIGDYYSTDMTTFLVGGTGQEVLNTEGGVVFSIGIPGLEQIRPNLFELTSGIEGYAPTDWTHAFVAETTWQTQLGTTASTALTAVGSFFGIDGKAVGAFLLMACYLALALVVVMAGGDATIAIILAVPFVLLGAWMRLIDIAIVAVVASVAVLLFIYRFWWSRT